MRLGVDFSILNQKGTPAFYSDIFANRPAAGFAGRVFISTDTGAIYEDTGSAWTLIADAGAGTTGTLQQVTTNGNTTSAGISVTAGGIGTNSLTVQGSRANFYNGTAAQLGMTLQNGSVPSTLTRGDLWLYSASSLNNNLVLANDLYNSQFLLPLSNQVFTYPDASGVIGLSSSALTAGSVVFAGTSGVLSENNTNFFWDNTNKYLGIGPTGTPTAPLDIHNGTVGQLIQLNATSTNNSNIAFLNGGVGKWRIGNVYNAGANDFNIHNIGTAVNAISINSSTSNVTFNGGLRTTGTADQQLWVYGTSPSIRLYDNATSPTINGFVGMATAANNFILGSASGDMCIGTITAGNIYIGSGTTTVNPAITITTSNIVRINGTGGTSPLNVTDGAKSTTNVPFTMTSNDGATAMQLYFQRETNARYNIQAVEQGVGYKPITLNALGGNILIGTTTDSGQKLQVNGTAIINGTYLQLNGLLYTAGNGQNDIQDTNPSDTDSRIVLRIIGGRYNATADSNTKMIKFASGNGTELGYITRNGGATISYVSSSDYRLKEDLKEFNGLDLISKIKTYDFKWKNSEFRDYGVIAHELKEIIPNIVSGIKDDIYEETGEIKPQGLDYGKLTPILIKAIQEINDKLIKNNIN